MRLPKNDNNRNNIIKYFTILLLILFHTLCIDIKSGVPLFILFLLVPPVSLAIVAAAAKKVNYSVQTDKKLYSKTEKISVTVTILSGSVVPLPFVYAGLCCSDRISGGGDFIISLTGGKKCIITQEYTANSFGPAEIGIKELKIYDFFGLFFCKRIFKGGNYTINIMPDIPHVPDNNMLNESMNVTQNDSEDEVETDLLSFNKLPGYEHREYKPGDPIKLINWKLSCKHDKYFIRNMESLASSKQMIVLGKNSSGNYLIDERTVEAMLAMVYAMVKRGISCNVLFFAETWCRINITSESELADFASVLADYSFYGNAGNDTLWDSPDKISESGINSFMLFTPHISTRLSELAEQMQNAGFFVSIATPKADILSEENVWLISSDYSFNRAIL